MPWGIYVDGILRHPSQLYEALLEGALVAIVLFLYRKKKKFNGELIALYGILYSVMRYLGGFGESQEPQTWFFNIETWFNQWGQISEVYKLSISHKGSYLFQYELKLHFLFL